MNIKLIMNGLGVVFVLGVALMFLAMAFPTVTFIGILVGSAIASFNL